MDLCSGASTNHRGARLSYPTLSSLAATTGGGIDFIAHHSPQLSAKMRICNAAASAALVAAFASLAVEAFAPSPNFTHRRSTATLRVLPDPVVVTSAVESSTVVTGAVMETLGSLALLGSVGFGVAVSKQNNKDWSYEYKPGSGYVEGGSDLALLEEDPVSVVEKVSL